MPDHDHVLGVSSSVRFNSNTISVWNKLGRNEASIKRLEQTILDRLSPDLRPAGPSTYSYKRHDENDGYQEAMQSVSAATKDDRQSADSG